MKTIDAQPVKENSRFAVIDTETTWGDDVMSIGIVISHFATFELLDKKYYVLTPFKNHGGMYSSSLYIEGVAPDYEGSRTNVMKHLVTLLENHGISSVFAYNASFDHRHLPELRHLEWFDIMKLAAYKQHNPRIPVTADCYRTGRLKYGYGVERVYRLMSDEDSYREYHNALTDAIDELKIMKMLNHQAEVYKVTKIKNTSEHKLSTIY